MRVHCPLPHLPVHWQKCLFSGSYCFVCSLSLSLDRFLPSLSLSQWLSTDHSNTSDGDYATGDLVFFSFSSPSFSSSSFPIIALTGGQSSLANAGANEKKIRADRPRQSEKFCSLSLGVPRSVSTGVVLCDFHASILESLPSSSLSSTARPVK